MTARRVVKLVAPLLALGMATACGGSGSSGSTGSSGGASSSASGQAVRGLQVVVPNSPGSGYDTTARAAVKAMEDAGLARSAEVTNVAGAGGTVGLQRVVNEKGNANLLLQMGLGVVGATTPTSHRRRSSRRHPSPGSSRRPRRSWSRRTRPTRRSTTW